MPTALHGLCLQCFEYLYALYARAGRIICLIILVTNQLFYRPASRARTYCCWDEDEEGERLLVEEGMGEINAEE